MAAARQTPALLREKLDAAEAHMRGRLAEMAGLLADRGEGARRLYRTLFPDGLHFAPVRVGKRSAWRIRGTACLFSDCLVTPPGIEPGIVP